MAEYLELFQDITSSADLLVSNKSSSQEIQGFAMRLNQAVQPCLSELEHSAGRLKKLLQPCFDELIQAEAEWQGKPDIIYASATDIREQVGHFIGYLFKVRLLKSQLTSQVLEQVQSSWQERVDMINVKWFIDPKNNSLKSVSPLDKEKFIQALRSEIHPQAIKIGAALSRAFQPIHDQLQQMQLNKVTEHLSLLTKREKLGYISSLENLNISILQPKMEKPLLHLPDGTLNFSEMVNPLIDNLINQGFLVGNLPGKSAIKSLMGHGILPLTWENFSQFAEDTHLAIEQFVNTVVEEVINSVTMLLEQSVQLSGVNYLAGFLRIDLVWLGNSRMN